MCWLCSKSLLKIASLINSGRSDFDGYIDSIESLNLAEKIKSDLIFKNTALSDLQNSHEKRVSE